MEKLLLAVSVGVAHIIHANWNIKKATTKIDDLI